MSTRAQTIQRALRFYAKYAAQMIECDGAKAQMGSRRVGPPMMVWRDALGGDLRTLSVHASPDAPLLIRICIDHDMVAVSKKAAEALGLDAQLVRPMRPKAEITVLPDEVLATILWSLQQDMRKRTSFTTEPPFEPWAEYKDWTYLWSRRAGLVNWAANGRHTSREVVQGRGQRP